MTGGVCNQDQHAVGHDGTASPRFTRHASASNCPGILLIGGPTASAKSAFALHLAETLGGEIVNADSMQIYAGLGVLTAQPSREERARVQHHLYGFQDPAYPGSVAHWLGLAEVVIREIIARRRLAIVVGGTGLYLQALLEGLAEMPDIPPVVRRATRTRLHEIGSPALHRELAGLDPESAARLAPGDSQRVARAFEVALASGETLAGWQRRPPKRPLLPGSMTGYALMPLRALLNQRIEPRLQQMMAMGAADEVEALLGRRLDPSLPAMKAVGIEPIAAYVRGEVSREVAIRQAVVRTRQLAKRQRTWFRNRLGGLIRIEGFGDDPGVLPAPHTVHDLVLTG